MLRAPIAVLALAAAVSAQTSAERLLASLSPEQRVGQLMMCWSLSRTDEGYARGTELRQWIEDPGIGGVILSLGACEDAAALVADLQARSPIPLLCAGDFENGVGFRLDGATDLGPQMLLGASGSAELARRAGAVTGIESRALGFHWDFAPVLDVNVDPANPIIQIRSFGEDPALVARLGVAWTQGLQHEGVLATGKHFPGHGDVSTDSHHELPVVPADRARLDAVELLPFRAAIAAGIGSIMTGHLSVAGLGVDPGTPATLSPEILTGLLRDELGFDGLVVTDALDMGGLKSVAPPEAAVRALLAGADLLLMPPDPRAARDAVLAAIADGRLAQARVDRACLRVLRFKERQGLLHGAGRPRADWRDAVGTPAHEALAEEIAARGLTLARDPHGTLPLRTRALTVVTLAPDREADAGGSLVAELSRFAQRVTLRRLSAADPDEAVAEADATLAQAQERGEAVVVALAHGRLGRVPAAFAALAARIDARPGGVLVVLGNPFAPATAFEHAAVVEAFGWSPRLERAAARALVGAAALTGRTPVTIPGVAARGDGLSLLPPGASLGDARPESEGFAPDLRHRIRGLLEAGVAGRAFPGAVAVVARRGRVVAEVAVGRETYADDAPPITTASRYDLASLTKVCATTPAVLTLVDAGRLDLDAKVTDLLPLFAGEDRQAVTVRHLLTHTAGLPPFLRFFETLEGKAPIVEAAARVPLEAAPGVRYRYSDIGMILLMAIVEKVGGEDFDRYVERAVFRPLGMRSATFARSGSAIAAVPTEDDPWRGRVVAGEVHDENAFAMGGVSGHAGLFADARDVARLGQAFVGGGRGLAAPALVREFVRRQELVAGSSRALGWDTFTAGSSGGSKLSARAFGHTGFTGTSLWCDPERDLTIVLLSNRVHPSRDNQGHAAVRRALADLVVAALDG
jgi:beta-glucosidase-like glycosyl hydrolase/CubicO group peptidase (beta-lactamase class C family)